MTMFFLFSCQKIRLVFLSLQFLGLLTADDAVDHLEEEVLDYTLMSAEELPATSTEATNSARNEELCSYWQGIGKLTTLDGLLCILRTYNVDGLQ